MGKYLVVEVGEWKVLALDQFAKFPTESFHCECPVYPHRSKKEDAIHNVEHGVNGDRTGREVIHSELIVDPSKKASGPGK